MRHALFNRLANFFPALVAFAAAATFCGAPALAHADNQQIYQHVIHSTAWIISPLKGDEIEEGTPLGTAVVVDTANPRLVTAYHVVQERKHVLVFFPKFDHGRAVTNVAAYLSDVEHNAISGTVIYADSKRDLAIISLESLPANTTATPIASQPCEPGESLCAIGNSGVNRDILWRFVDGMVRQICPNYSMPMRTRGDDGKESNVQELTADMIEAQLPINSGDSGGPVVNSQGQLVGIVSSDDVEEHTVSYLVDARQVRAALAACPAVKTPAKAVISLVNVEHNAQYAMDHGLMVHVDFRTDGCRSEECEVTLRFYGSEGCQSTRGLGRIVHSVSLTPSHDHSTFTDQRFFLSNAELNAARTADDLIGWCSVEIRDKKTGQLLSDGVTWALVMFSK